MMGLELTAAELRQAAVAEAFQEVLEVLDEDGGCARMESGPALICCWASPDELCPSCAETKGRITAVLSRLVNQS